MTDDEPTRLFICAGPPACDLECDEAIAAMEAGCPWCTVETLAEGEVIHTRAPTNQ